MPLAMLETSCSYGVMAEMTQSKKANVRPLFGLNIRENRASVSTNSTFVFCNRRIGSPVATAKGL